MSQGFKRIKETRGRPGIMPSVKKLIYAKALEDRTKPRNVLAVELNDLIKQMRELPLAKETIEKLISRARNHPLNPLDEIWNLSKLEDYPIPSEALPFVLEVWLHYQKEFRPLAIREAKWVSHFYELFKDDINKLARVAEFYAQEELLSEVSGVSFYEFNGQKGILNLYEEWKGRFPQEQRSQLLAAPVILGHYPEGLSVAEQHLSYAKRQGEGLRRYRKPPDAREEALEAGNE